MLVDAQPSAQWAKAMHDALPVHASSSVQQALLMHWVHASSPVVGLHEAPELDPTLPNTPLFAPPGPGGGPLVPLVPPLVPLVPPLVPLVPPLVPVPVVVPLHAATAKPEIARKATTIALVLGIQKS